MAHALALVARELLTLTCARWFLAGGRQLGSRRLSFIHCKSQAPASPPGSPTINSSSSETSTQTLPGAVTTGPALPAQPGEARFIPRCHPCFFQPKRESKLHATMPTSHPSACPLLSQLLSRQEAGMGSPPAPLHRHHPLRLPASRCPSCRHPKQATRGTIPSLFEVEKRRHRKVKGLTSNEQV